MKYLYTAFALAATLGATSVAQADTWHQTNTEAGYEIHVENNAGKSVETVRQELMAAKADKQAWYYSYRAQPQPFWMTKSEKTRQQVQAERDAVTPEQRARWAEIYGAGA